MTSCCTVYLNFECNEISWLDPIASHLSLKCFLNYNPCSGDCASCLTNSLGPRGLRLLFYFDHDIVGKEFGKGSAGQFTLGASPGVAVRCQLPRSAGS